MKKRIMAAVMAVALLTGLAVLVPTAASAAEVCPNTGTDGWIKVNLSSGAVSGAFGSFEWDGLELDYDLAPGYELDFCLKYSEVREFHEGITGAGTLETDGKHDISHIGYRIHVPDEPTVVNAVLSGRKLGEDGDNDSLPDGLADWEIDIYEYDAGDPPGDLLDTVTTDENGEWTWIGPDVAPDVVQTYVVCEVVQTGWEQLNPVSGDPGTIDVGDDVCHLVVATGDELVLGLDFTNDPDRSISGSKHFRTADGTKLVGWSIVVTDASDVVICDTVTDSSGDWTCEIPGPGTYTVTETLPSGPGYTWTQVAPAAPGTHVVVFDPNVAVDVVDADFVNDCTVDMRPGGHTIGFWGNKNGQAEFNDASPAGDQGTAANIAGLQALNLKTATGANFDPGTYAAFKTWLGDAKAVDMRYMLSAQLAATYLNTTNKIGSSTVTNGAFLAEWTVNGITTTQTIDAWIAEASGALNAGLSKTVLGEYKNLFDAINNNAVLGQSPGTPETCGATAVVTP